MSVHPAAPSVPPPLSRPTLSLPRLHEMAARGDKLAMLTCYDATFARVLDDAGVDILLVGDSLGNVIQGETSTLPVELEHMVYHTRCVARGRRSAWLIADLPFGSYEASPEQALAASVALMRAGAQMVKLEGGGVTAQTVRFLTERGIPVCAHLGLTPQRVHALGGYRVQGRSDAAAAELQADAAALAEAGAAMLVLELVPSALATAVTQAHPGLLTIGIGAGPHTSGQVLVLHDMLGLTPGRRPRFVRDFSLPPGAAAIAEAGCDTRLGVHAAVAAYVAAVKQGSFPDPAQHGY